MRRPEQLLVFDTVSGKRLAAVPCVGDTDDLFYDVRRDRVYVIGGEGFVDVFDAAASGKYDRLAPIATRAGARTGLWSEELDRLFVAWPSRDGHPAEIHMLGAPAEPRYRIFRCLRLGDACGDGRPAVSMLEVSRCRITLRT